MLEKNYIKLELNKILNILEEYCVTEVGKNFLKTLSPSNNKLIVKHLLSETTQAYNLLSESGNPPISELYDYAKLIKLLESSATLSCKNLLFVAHILKTSKELKTYFSSVENASKYDSLENYFNNLYTNSDLENTIFRSILDENTIADEASSTLNSIRRKKRNLEASIKENLNRFIHSSSYSKFIMDPIITIRNNRYVIPVKVEYKENIKGFVHDVSYSGSTVYIEPISIFELNNQIHNLQLEENVEIEKILKELSNSIFPITNNIKLSLESIGNLDLIFAKAKFSVATDSTEPLINEEKIVYLKEARHPLIDSKLVVPIDIEIGKKYTSLIITGPNTGGKTVSLKTTGLLCLMAYLGLHIPAKEGSSLFVFDNVFADIGDEQSIQESLSTFSSHMLNIVDIYNQATEKSLILVDELGSGTDPLQGANLAISILEYFHNLGAICLATTHYQEIKNYALVTDGFENASSEFDIENLKPTYKLLVGVPGKSNAFAITKRLGMPDSILSRAQELMNDDHISVEELIKNIYDDKLEIEKEKEKIKKNSNQIEMLRKSLDSKNAAFNDKETTIIEKAKIEAREILLKAKRNANSIISELNKLYSNDSSNSLKQANSIRNKLNENIQEISTIVKSTDNASTNIKNVEIGMSVLVKTLNQQGVILSLPNKSNEVQVQIGSMKMNVKLNNLSLVKVTKNEKINNVYNTKTPGNKLKSKTATTEINVIGQNVEEAIFVIDKFLDDSALANLPNVRIVHGKGTGKLRKGIHDYLKRHPHVKTFRLGVFGEGEMGVTIVELK
ncbi:MAG: endonuclease MutS2 [Clostridia bacterium]|nr:endonuclease MutS2 [Clostridia bacterium]